MILRIAVILFFCTQIFAQNIKPTNGVSENYQPIFAFKNANIIISPNTKLENATLLIKGNRIIAVDTNLEIPVGSIVTNLDGDYIYPSFIDLYSSYGVEKQQKRLITIVHSIKLLNQDHIIGTKQSILK